MGWDVPFSDEGAWSVPADSDAAAPCVGIGGYRKHGDASASSLPKPLRTLLSLREFLIGCYYPGHTSAQRPAESFFIDTNFTAQPSAAANYFVELRNTRNCEEEQS